MKILQIQDLVKNLNLKRQLLKLILTKNIIFIKSLLLFISQNGNFIHTFMIYSYLYYIVIFYLVGTFLEWYIHKYIMHGNENDLKNIIIIGDILKDIAVSHKLHHINVNMDMTLNDDHDNGKCLFFGWYYTSA